MVITVQTGPSAQGLRAGVMNPFCHLLATRLFIFPFATSFATCLLVLPICHIFATGLLVLLTYHVLVPIKACISPLSSCFPSGLQYLHLRTRFKSPQSLAQVLGSPRCESSALSVLRSSQVRTLPRHALASALSASQSASGDS